MKLRAIRCSPAFAGLALLICSSCAIAESAVTSAPPLPIRKPPNPGSWATQVCGLIEKAADNHGLPAEFFTRLIWQESSFNPQAISRVGAQGIAQFMPGTAAERRLDDPFDPERAIAASASLLQDLRVRFGNLGLAAAAYNGGPNRVANWIGRSSYLPAETQNYVYAITGRAAEDWAIPPGERAAGDDISDTKLFSLRCDQVVANLRVRERQTEATIATAPRSPWGVQLAGNFSRSIALATFQRLQTKHRAILGGRDPMVLSGRMRSRGTRAFFRIGVPSDTRQAATQLCTNLRAAGGACIVMKN